MKKLGLMSDLHIDSNGFGDLEVQTLLDVLKEENISHLHVAGDISNQWKEISLPFLERLADSHTVTWNLGNHDMLGLSEEDIQEESIKVYPLGDKTLVSVDGWYDYSFVPEFSYDQHLRNKRLYWFDRRLERVGSDPEITEALLTRLEKVLDGVTGTIVVAMHFVPHDQFLLRHPYFQRFNAFLGSPRFHKLFSRYAISDVVFGHTHHRFANVDIDGISYHCKPLGYQREWRLVEDFFTAYPEYRIEKMYHLHKRFAAIKDLPEFQDFRRQHLKEEFREALTVLEYQKKI